MNYTYPRVLSVKDGILIQQEHLAKWQKLLKPEVFDKLKIIVKRDNDKVTDGYNVCRGVDIENILINDVAAVS